MVRPATAGGRSAPTCPASRPKRPGPLETDAILTLPLVRLRVLGHRLRAGTVVRRILADRHVALAAATVLPVVVMEALNEIDDRFPTVVPAARYVSSPPIPA